MARLDNNLIGYFSRLDAQSALCRSGHKLDDAKAEQRPNGLNNQERKDSRVVMVASFPALPLRGSGRRPGGFALYSVNLVHFPRPLSNPFPGFACWAR